MARQGEGSTEYAPNDQSHAEDKKHRADQPPKPVCHVPILNTRPPMKDISR